MHFNPAKYYYTRFTNKWCHIVHSYFIHNAELGENSTVKYLGISSDNKLTWRNRVDSIVGKANSIIGFLARNFKHCSVDVKHRCYLTLICPVLEYAASVWSPYLLTLMNRIESVQRCSARLIFNDYRRTSSVTCMMEKLNYHYFQIEEFATE